MTDVTAHDVAHYILEETGRIQAIKLQKLCYLAQGWHLTWLGDPLFDDEIKAWRYGPVVYSLYREHAGSRHLDSWDFGEPDVGHLNSTQKKLIDMVIETNAHKSGFDLVRETHTHDIWKKKFEQVPSDRKGYETLNVEDIRKEFDRIDEELMAES